MNWVELPPGSYRLRSPSQATSTCQYEVDLTNHERLISHLPDSDEWSNVAPLRILSFDIECAGRKQIFPEAHTDPVIQIAATLTIQGDACPRVRAVFCLGSCANIIGAEVYWFDREEEMMMAWVDFLQQVLDRFFSFLYCRPILMLLLDIIL